jgi:Methyltransferase domain
VQLVFEYTRRCVNRVRTVARRLLPAQLYRLVHVLYHFARVRYQRFIFFSAMRNYLANPSSCSNPGNPVLQALIYGWGNDEWTASEEYLAACIQHAFKSHGPILECGSGLTTILVAAVAKETGRPYWALEHLAPLAAKTQAYLTKYGLASVFLSLTPLVEYRDFTWYDAPLHQMPDSFTLVLCDGPPGMTKGGRYGLVPVMKDRLAHGCTILLDDAARVQESAIARRWQLDLGAGLLILGSKKPYIEMTVP